MIGIGGWEPKDTSVGLYSQLIANKTSIDKFVESSVAFLQRFQFDGFQIEWQFLYQAPHQEGFVYLVTALRKAFRELGYLLGATVTPLVLKVRKRYQKKFLFFIQLLMKAGPNTNQT
jgi:chitinase